jgi:hypothetical protein
VNGRQKRGDSGSLRVRSGALGYSGYQPLIRAYVGRGLRKDLERLDRSPGQALAESLRKRGMSDSTIAEVIAEAKVS